MSIQVESKLSEKRLSRSVAVVVLYKSGFSPGLGKMGRKQTAETRSQLIRHKQKEEKKRQARGDGFSLARLTLGEERMSERGSMRERV